jgi:uncharacterized protein
VRQRIVPRIILIGASVRAAALSAVRAGFAPWCADLFADTDLTAVDPDAVRLSFDDYPHGFRDILKRAPDAPFVYTGGLENFPDLIDELAAIRPLRGIGGDALRRVRSPSGLQALLREGGFPTVATLAHDDTPDPRRRWLRKPVRSAGGNGIRLWDGSPWKPSEYLQEFLEGPAMSAIFVDGHLFGITQQLIGEPWLQAPPYAYCGNIGPIDDSVSCRETIASIGEHLARTVPLGGVFGIDFLLKDGVPYVVEVNPRYPASVEVIERATGRAVWGPQQIAGAGPVCGKAIVYADRDFPFERSMLPAGDDIAYADIPADGEPMPAGWPVCTILAAGLTISDVRESLTEAAGRIRR